MAKMKELIDACTQNGIDVAVVLNMESVPGARPLVQPFGNKLSCCGFFDSINALTRVCEKTYGEGTLKQHCRRNPKSHLPQAIGLGREFN